MKRALLWVCILLSGCTPHPTATPTPTPESSESPESSSLHLDQDQQNKAGLRVQTLTARPFQHVLDATGVLTFDPQGRSEVTSPVSGRIVRLGASLGSVVHSGQELAWLESAQITETRLRYHDLALRLNLAERQLGRRGQLSRLADANRRPLEEGQESQIDDRANLAKARAALDVSRKKRERVHALLTDGIVSQQQVEEADGAYREALASLRQAQERQALSAQRVQREDALTRSGARVQTEVQTAQNEVERLRAELTQTRKVLELYNTGPEDRELTLRAPASGIVVARPVALGQAVTAETSLMTLQDATRLLVRIDLPEASLSDCRLGMPIQVRSSVPGAKPIPGKIVSLPSALDPTTRTARVLARVANPRGQLKAEMFVSVRLGLTRHSKGLVIPTAAIQHSDQGDTVYVQTGPEKFEQRRVELGAQDLQESREVHSGLSAGERLVVQGALMLQSEQHKSALKGDSD